MISITEDERTYDLENEQDYRDYLDKLTKEQRFEERAYLKMLMLARSYGYRGENLLTKRPK